MRYFGVVLFAFLLSGLTFAADCRDLEPNSGFVDRKDISTLLRIDRALSMSTSRIPAVVVENWVTGEIVSLLWREQLIRQKSSYLSLAKSRSFSTNITDFANRGEVVRELRFIVGTGDWVAYVDRLKKDDTLILQLGTREVEERVPAFMTRAESAGFRMIAIVEKDWKPNDPLSFAVADRLENLGRVTQNEVMEWRRQNR